MLREFLPQNEYDSALTALESILSQPVENIDLTDSVPPLDDITDSNKVFKGKLSILFVDMRKSTDLTDELKSKKMVKVYRAFTRMVIQAIRYSGGHARQFAGDGIMGVFQDSKENDTCILSSQKAVDAARYIHTLIDFCLNPALKKQLGDISIGCGVGVCTGEIMITKVGMRGKEADDTVENETGVVWVGSTTNYASRFCGLASPREIFIDTSTYHGIVPHEIWEQTSRTKGNKVFDGYVASEFYFPLPKEIVQEPIKSKKQTEPNATFIQDIFDETQERSLALVDEISKKSATLSVALENLKQREQQILVAENNNGKENIRLQQWQQRLDARQTAVDEKEQRNKFAEYAIYENLFRSVHCKEQFALGMGKDFWDKKLQNMVSCGARIGKNIKDVKSEICYALVDLYENLEMYDEAYNALCIQAETHSWIHAHTVESILAKTYLRTQLRETIEARLKTPLGPEIRKSLQECLTKIK